jgi:tartrate dehydratase alpha subunit/fumarate hydratase class I-like protein
MLGWETDVPLGGGVMGIGGDERGVKVGVMRWQWSSCFVEMSSSCLMERISRSLEEKGEEEEEKEEGGVR